MKKYVIGLIPLLSIILLLILICSFIIPKISYEIISINTLHDIVNVDEYKYYDANYNISNYSENRVKKVKVDCKIENMSLMTFEDVCMEFKKTELPEFICGYKFDTQLVAPLLLNRFENKKVSFYFLIDESKLSSISTLEAELAKISVFISNKGKRVSLINNLCVLDK